MHRFCIYAFIVFRVELVSRKDVISGWKFRAGKCAVLLFCSCLLVFAIVFPYGVEDENWACNLEMDWIIIYICFAFDMILLFGASWLFIRPLWNILKTSDDDTALRITVRKELVWLGLSVLVKLLTFLTLGLVDGSGGVIGFDCSISSFCLVMVMTPIKQRSTDGDWTKSEAVVGSCDQELSSASCIKMNFDNDAAKPDVRNNIELTDLRVQKQGTALLYEEINSYLKDSTIIYISENESRNVDRKLSNKKQSNEAHVGGTVFHFYGTSDFFNGKSKSNKSNVEEIKNFEIVKLS